MKVHRLVLTGLLLVSGQSFAAVAEDSTQLASEVELDAPITAIADDVKSSQKEANTPTGSEDSESSASKFDPINDKLVTALECLQKYVKQSGSSKAASLSDTLTQISSNVDATKGYFDLYSKGENKEFNFAFGCSTLGDIAMQISNADLQLGYPANKAAAWRTGVDSIQNSIKKARSEFACP